MRVAALDLGTNTFLLLIAEVEDGKIIEVLHDEVRVVRLGQGVHENRRLHPEALERARSCLTDYAATIKKINGQKTVERILACATSAARDVTNRDELIQIGRDKGIEIKVISGEQEAELTFSGTIQEELGAPVLIIDIGGGSTEFILGGLGGIIARKSLDIGAVRLTEMFVTQHPVPPHELSKMTALIQQKLSELKDVMPVRSIERLVAVAGTPTTLAAVDLQVPFDTKLIDGYVLSLHKIRQWTQRLSEMTIPERQALAGMEPKRADVLVAGSLILMLACQYFQSKEIQVSIRGLRYGIAKQLALSPTL